MADTGKEDLEKSVRELLEQRLPKRMGIRQAAEALGALLQPADAADGPRRTMGLREAAEILGALPPPADEDQRRDANGKWTRG